jgi:hypothetical protein
MAVKAHIPSFFDILVKVNYDRIFDYLVKDAMEMFCRRKGMNAHQPPHRPENPIGCHLADPPCGDVC